MHLLINVLMALRCLVVLPFMVIKTDPFPPSTFSSALLFREVFFVSVRLCKRIMKHKFFFFDIERRFENLTRVTMFSSLSSTTVLYSAKPTVTLHFRTPFNPQTVSLQSKFK